MADFPVDACSDITGFGLAGHLREMLAGAPFSITVNSSSVPLLPGAADYAATGLIPAGMYRNRDFVGGLCDIGPAVERSVADIIFDPQTSGGLCIALDEERAFELADRLISRGIAAAVIGRVERSDRARLRIV
jgi:selenide,water dikinase